jgi:RNA polymerase sigma-70 factor (ECF subfamily)
MFDHARALRGCANGDRAALKAVFEEEGGRLVGVAQRILRRRDLAEEAVQDAFVQIWRKAGQYDPDRGSAQGWLFTVVRNRALSMLRDTAREDLAPAEEMDSLREADPVDEAWARLDEKNRLRACLEALDEPKRRSVLMAYVTGYSHGEIAGRLNVPLGTAKAWVRRGLAALRECMS